MRWDRYVAVDAFLARAKKGLLKKSRNFYPEAAVVFDQRVSLEQVRAAAKAKASKGKRRKHRRLCSR